MAAKDFEQLVSEAEQAAFSGWDFSYLDGRWQEQEPAWDYRALVSSRLGQASALLDMGTGGGEFLASLAGLPDHTCATEGYPPNLPLARARLEPLGITVRPVEADLRLPFDDQEFDLVINRHEEFDPREVRRILRPGGIFLTQQVGGEDNRRLNDLLEDEPHLLYEAWNLEHARAEIEAGGLRVLTAAEDFPETIFYDIGAVVYYLKAIPWQIENFNVQESLARLKQIHELIQAEGGLRVQSQRFVITATRN